MSNIEKVKSLFNYLAELSALKYKIVTDVRNQEWTLFTDSIPEDNENIVLYSRDSTVDVEFENPVLLKVKKPDFTIGPKPPKTILNWVENGWDNYRKDVVVLDQILKTDSSEEEYEEFSESLVRVFDYENWVEKRDHWVKEQKIIKTTRDFFSNLYRIYTLLERESEVYEFVVGNGILKDIENPIINHPLLLKRVKFDFDAYNNEIKIVDTEKDSDLYNLLLKEVRDINHAAINYSQEDLANNYYHPLDKNDTNDFLKQLTNNLSDRSSYLETKDVKAGYDDKLSIAFNPVFIVRKRIDGTLEMIEDIKNDIENKGEVPGHFVDLVGDSEQKELKKYEELSIDEHLAASSGENVNILLSKEANREQLEIAERIEEHNAVLVQGPPGTGKTHTISNLLGHFLSQGKTVLVTSHTKKALSVLKYQVPKDIQHLCVSILDDSNKDMISSVDGIIEKLSRHTSSELNRKIQSTKVERQEIIKELAEVRRRIFAIKNKEYKAIVYNGQDYSPAEAARFVNKYSQTLDYIPGFVELNTNLPLPISELNQLYRSNESISSQDEEELAFSIPHPDELISISEFNNQLRIEENTKQAIKDLENQLKIKINFDFINKSIIDNSGQRSQVIVEKPTKSSINVLSEYVNAFYQIDAWMIQAAVDGKRERNYKKQWEMLIDLITNTANYQESILTNMLGNDILIKDTLSLDELKFQVLKLKDIFDRKGKLSKLNFLFNKELENAYSLVTINNKPINSLDDCELVLSKIELMKKKSETANLWDALLVSHGTTSFFELGDEASEIASQRIPNILKYLNWYRDEYSKFEKLVLDAGFNMNAILQFSDLDSEYEKTKKIMHTISTLLPLYISLVNNFLDLQSIKESRLVLKENLNQGKRAESVLCNEMLKAIDNKDKNLYSENFLKLSNLYQKYKLQEERSQALDIISDVAPDWAAAIANRQGIHGNNFCPDDIKEAYKWKQFKGLIEDITKLPLKELQKKSLQLSQQLRDKTGDLVSHKSWYHLMVRTESNIRLKQDLQGWKLTVQKIGKGTGKRAPKLRKEARKKMEKSQKAVPAWIMPLNAVFETFKVPDNKFDVLIVDEASQSDISALAAMYLADKIIIVGDDKQVSPLAVGMNIDKIDALREMHIKDLIPNWHLYDAKTSLYDIAGTTFPPLMLEEHFRCVPEIIGYSNRLSYEHKIKPLRDANSSPILPAVVSHRVLNGQRDGRRKTNLKEAEKIVSIIKACIKQPEYADQTIGVISLLGFDQARLIEGMILEHIPATEILKRRILCGDASHFQGDERDVIFISLVDSNDSEGPLRMRGVGASNSIKQRYNVAASRARNQLWVVHSLDYSSDLQEGDMRKGLIEYATDPNAFSTQIDKVKSKADSPFEEEVALSLISAGFNIEQQWQVGAYSIDMVAKYNDAKIAIECDGEQFHSGEEKVKKDMERQTILERLGWRFIRLRGSEYYLDKDAAITRVIKDLNNYGIKPEKIIIKNKAEQESELLNKVRINASKINRNIFKNEDEDFKLEENIVKEDLNKNANEELKTEVDKPLIKSNVDKNSKVTNNIQFSNKEDKTITLHETLKSREINPKASKLNTMLNTKIKEPLIQSEVENKPKITKDTESQKDLKSKYKTLSAKEIEASQEKNNSIPKLKEKEKTEKNQMQESSSYYNRLATNPQPIRDRGTTPVDFYSIDKKTKSNLEKLKESKKTKEKDGSKKSEIERLSNLVKKPIKSSKKIKSISKSNQFKTIDNNNFKMFLESLEKYNIEYIDNSSESGILWAIYQKDKRKDFELVVNKSGYKYTIEPRGGISTNNRAAWRVMIK